MVIFMKKIFPVFILLSLFALVLCGSGYAESVLSSERDMSYQDFLIKEAELPLIPQHPDMSNAAEIDDAMQMQFKVWMEAKAEHQKIVIPEIEILQDFVREFVQRLYEERGATNFLYSPSSLWFCLRTLAELTDGNSQAQILQLIGQQTADARDKQTDALFRSLYWEETDSICVPAVSLWLDMSTEISESMLERLARAYTSTFQGKMGDMLYDTALQLWLNEQTRGILENTVSDLRFSPKGGLSVCSTLYLKSNWRFPFSKDKTVSDLFFSETGEMETDFMHSCDVGVIYEGKGFKAIILDFQEGGGVTFVLPDSGVSMEDTLNNEDIFHFLFSGREWTDSLYGKINLSVPRMDCLADMSLRSSLEKLGITDVFDPQKAQFSSELSSDSVLALSDLHQYARLILNEDGVEAAAITISSDQALLMQPENEIDFILNRPFLFAVMSEKNIPLFVGVYHTPV